MKTLDIACSGYAVKADWHGEDNPDEVLLALIGWPSIRTSYTNLLSSIVASTGISALVFDYSGLGDSPLDVDDTCPAQHFLEVIHVYDWIRTTYPDAHITVMGTSYGGYLAAQLTKYRSFDRLILRVPAIYPPEDFYTLNKVINSDSGWAAKTIFRKDIGLLSKHPLLARASSFKGKALVIAHENDKEVPKETTDAYIKTFKSDVYIAKGFPHQLSTVSRNKITAYQDTISDWILGQKDQQL